MKDITIPKDVRTYKTKAIGNFSSRELIFGSISAGVIAWGIFGWASGIEDLSLKALASALPALPFLLIGFVKPFGIPFEKTIGGIIFDNFVCPLNRYDEVTWDELEKKNNSRSYIKDKNKKTKIKCKPSKKYKAIK